MSFQNINFTEQQTKGLLLPLICRSKGNNSSKPKPTKKFYSDKVLSVRNEDIYRMTTKANSIFGCNIKQGQGQEGDFQKISNKFRTTLRKPSYIENVQLAEKANKGKCIGKYRLGKQIGKGGFAMVYEAFDVQGNKYALKQYSLSDSTQSYTNECRIGNYFFKKGDGNRDCFSQNLTNSSKNISGSRSIIRFFDSFKHGKKGYIVQEIGGIPFSKLLSELKGVFYNKERVYEVEFKEFYQRMKSRRFFKEVIGQIVEGVYFLKTNGLVHSDLKLENILILDNSGHKGDESYQNPRVKIIDYGSTFELNRSLPKITITPEYMPPELLVQFANEKGNGNGYSNKELLQGCECGNNFEKVDVWSIGCILLQIFTGIPLWFRYKCKIESKNRTVLGLGIYALTGRDYNKIIKKQKQLCSSIVNSIQFTCGQFEQYRKLLQKIFVFDQKKRISIEGLLKEIKEIKEGK